MKLIAKFIIGAFVLSGELFGCASSYGETFVVDEYYNFINPKMVNMQSEDSIYNLPSSSAKGGVVAYNERVNKYNEISKIENIKEWSKYFANRLSKKEIETIFYGEDRYANTTITKSAKPYMHKLDDKFKKYISFLDLQMPLATANKPSTELINTMKKQALLLSRNCDDKFLKSRYAFLILRLYHYSGDYESAIDFYEKNSVILNSNWLIKEWSDALYAGAIKRVGMQLKANELYADIFQNNKTNPYIGFYDFEIKDDAMWKAQLANAKNNDDKARLYFMRAMDWKNEPIYELEEIVKIAPQSIWFDRLSYMIMQSLQNQRYSMSSSYYNDRYEDGKAQKSAYDASNSYYYRILASQKNPSFFTTYAQLYLDALGNKPLSTEKLSLLKSKANSQTGVYVELVKYLYDLNAFKSTDIAEQNAFYEKLKPIISKLDEKQKQSLLRYTALNIATLYPKNSVQRELASDYANDYATSIGYLLANSDADELEHYTNQQKSFLDNEIFKLYTNIKEDKGYSYYLMTTLFMQKNDFTKAKQYALKIKDKDLLAFSYNPFNISLSGNNRKPIKTGYCLIKFIETMITLQNKIKTKSATDMDYYLYANGLYNKSWFGNVPTSAMYYRSIYIGKDDAKYRAFNLSTAKKEYISALQKTNDNELKAKISYQLLKIDLANAMLVAASKDKYGFYSNSGDFDETAKELLKQSKDFRENTKAYKAKYQNTKNGKETIKQCATFRHL